MGCGWIYASADTPAPPAGGEQQKAVDAQRASVEKMRESIEAQKKSVRGQTEGARRRPAGVNPPDSSKTPGIEPISPLAPGEFFVIPWTEPMPSLGAYLDCPEIPHTELARYIQQAADREGLSPDLLRAVIGKESAYRPCAVSPRGALGLMQLMPETASSLNVRDPFNPKDNIDGGSRLLRALLNRYGNDLSLALGAYNAGPGAVERAGGVPAYSETQHYVADILGRLGFQ